MYRMIQQSKWKAEWDGELRLLPQVESVTNADLQISENLFMLCHFLKLYQSANPQVKNVLDFLVSRNLQPLNWGSYFDEVMTRGMSKAKQLFNIMLSQSRKVHMRYAKKRPNIYLQFYPMRKYIILERINTGSVGQVHLAVEESTGEYFAAKAIDKSITQGDLGLFKKMKEEIKISCGMNHPNVVKTIGVMESAEKVIQIMEYCDGGDLISYVRNKLYLNESSAQYFFKKIVEGLKYMHKNNIAHRDLKPENIFLCKKNLSKKERTLIRIGKLPACAEYELKIGDFGASCIIENNKMLYDIVGTLSYAAPEVLGCTGTSGYDGKKADVWSLGIILYAMFFGLLPFENEDKGVKDAYREIMKTQISFPKNRVNKFSNIAKNLLYGMLNVNPEKRMSLQDVLNHRWLSDHPQSRMEISYLHKKVNVPFSSTVAYPIYSPNCMPAPTVNHNIHDNAVNTNANQRQISNANHMNHVNNSSNNNSNNKIGMPPANLVHNAVHANQSNVYQNEESNGHQKYNNFMIYKNLLMDLRNPNIAYKKEPKETKAKHIVGTAQDDNSYIQEHYEITEPTNEYRNCEGYFTNVVYDEEISQRGSCYVEKKKPIIKSVEAEFQKRMSENIVYMNYDIKDLMQNYQFVECGRDKEEVYSPHITSHANVIDLTNVYQNNPYEVNEMIGCVNPSQYKYYYVNDESSCKMYIDYTNNDIKSVAYKNVPIPTNEEVYSKEIHIHNIGEIPEQENLERNIALINNPTNNIISDTYNRRFSECVYSEMLNHPEETSQIMYHIKREEPIGNGKIINEGFSTKNYQPEESYGKQIHGKDIYVMNTHTEKEESERRESKHYFKNYVNTAPPNEITQMESKKHIVNHHNHCVISQSAIINEPPIQNIFPYKPNRKLENGVYANQTQQGDAQTYDGKKGSAITNYETYMDQNIEEEPFQIRKKTTYNNQFPIEEDMISMKLQWQNPIVTNLNSLEETFLPKNQIASVEIQWSPHNQGSKELPKQCKEVEIEKSANDIKNNQSKLVQFHRKSEDSNQIREGKNNTEEINQKEPVMMPSSHIDTTNLIEKEEPIINNETVNTEIILSKESIQERNNDLPPIVSSEPSEQTKEKETSQGQINISKYPNILKLFKNVDLSYKRKSFMEKDLNLIDQLTCQTLENREINKEEEVEEKECEQEKALIKEKSIEGEPKSKDKNTYGIKKEEGDAIGYEEFIFGEHKNPISQKFMEKCEERMTTQDIQKSTYPSSLNLQVPNEITSTEVSQLVKQFLKVKINSDEKKILFNKNMEEHLKNMLKEYSVEYYHDNSNINQIESKIDSDVSLELFTLYDHMIQESSQKKKCENKKMTEEDINKEISNSNCYDVNSLEHETIIIQNMSPEVQRGVIENKEEIGEQKNQPIMETQLLNNTNNNLEIDASALDGNSTGFEFLVKSDGKEDEDTNHITENEKQGNSETAINWNGHDKIYMDGLSESPKKKINSIQKTQFSWKQNQNENKESVVEIKNMPVGDSTKDEEKKNIHDNAPYDVKKEIHTNLKKNIKSLNEIEDTQKEMQKNAVHHIVTDQMIISTYLCNEEVNYFKESDNKMDSLINDINRKENDPINNKDECSDMSMRIPTKVAYHVMNSEKCESSTDINTTITNDISNGRLSKEVKENVEACKNPSTENIHEHFKENKNTNSSEESTTKRDSNEVMHLSYSNFSNHTSKDDASEDMIHLFRKNAKRYSLGEFTNSYLQNGSSNSYSNHSASIDCGEQKLRKAISSADIKNICKEIYKMENEPTNRKSICEFYTANTNAAKPVECFTKGGNHTHDRRKTHSMFNVQETLVMKKIEANEMENHNKKQSPSVRTVQEFYNEEEKKEISEIIENNKERRTNHTLLKGKQYIEHVTPIKEPTHEFIKNANLTNIQEKYEKDIQSSNPAMEFQNETTHLKRNEFIYTRNQGIDHHRKEVLESNNEILLNEKTQHHAENINGMKKYYKGNLRIDPTNTHGKKMVEESNNNNNNIMENTIIYIKKQIENNYAHLHNQNYKINKTNKNMIPKNKKPERRFTRNVENTLPENRSSFSPDKIFSSSYMNLSKSFVNNMQHAKFFDDAESTESMNCEHNLLKKSFHYLPHTYMLNSVIAQNHMNQPENSFRNLMNSNYYICNNWNASQNNMKRKEEMKNCMRLNKSSFHCVSNPYAFNKHKSTVISNKNNLDINLLQTKIKYGSVFTRNGPSHPRVQTKGKI